MQYKMFILKLSFLCLFIVPLTCSGCMSAASQKTIPPFNIENQTYKLLNEQSKKQEELNQTQGPGTAILWCPIICICALGGLGAGGYYFYSLATYNPPAANSTAIVIPGIQNSYNVRHHNRTWNMKALKSRNNPTTQMKNLLRSRKHKPWR
jgi:hypothetical protein